MAMNKFITFAPRHHASAVCGENNQKIGGEEISPHILQ